MEFPTLYLFYAGEEGQNIQVSINKEVIKGLFTAMNIDPEMGPPSVHVQRPTGHFRIGATALAQFSPTLLETKKFAEQDAALGVPSARPQPVAPTSAGTAITK